MAITDKQLSMLNDKSTVILIPAEGQESKLAMRFLKANVKKAIDEQRVFDELHLLALQGGIRVCFVFRDCAKPVMEPHVRNDGAMTAVMRPEKELMDEMQVSHSIEPKFVREHPLRPAILDVPGFLEEVGKNIVPMGMRLAFVDLGSQRPQVLRLSWC